MLEKIQKSKQNESALNKIEDPTKLGQEWDPATGQMITTTIEIETGDLTTSQAENRTLRTQKAKHVMEGISSSTSRGEGAPSGLFVEAGFVQCFHILRKNTVEVSGHCFQHCSASFVIIVISFVYSSDSRCYLLRLPLRQQSPRWEKRGTSLGKVLKL